MATYEKGLPRRNNAPVDGQISYDVEDCVEAHNIPVMDLDPPKEESELASPHRIARKPHGDNESSDVKHESAEGDSAGETEQTQNEPLEPPRGIKRKREIKRGRYKKKPRHLEYSNDVEQYQRLYNADVHEFDRRFECPEGRTEQGEIKHRLTKQYGMSKWTREEQDRLFRGLRRYGRGALQELTTVVPSKSEFEISQYLLLLKTSLNEQLAKKPSRQYLARYSDIPASLEVSERCCTILDEIAREYSQIENKRLESVAKYDHDLIGVIDRAKAARLGALVDGDASSDGELQTFVAKLPYPISPALQLFDLNTWLSLSEKLYMNPATEDNWHAIVEGDETPSILLTPVLDLYTIVITLMKRLVSASIFQALSRLRASDSGTREREIAPEVTVDDVHTALDIFNMAHDVSEYWLGVAERCKLTIYGENKSRLSYEEVARCLEFGYSIREDRNLSNAKQNLAQDQAQLFDEDVPFLPFDGEEMNDPTVDIHEHANAIDERHSIEEEKRLWAMFGRAAPLTDAIPSQRKPEETQYGPKIGHRLEDFDDWRDKLDYQAEWERYGYNVPQQDFQKGDASHIQRAAAVRPQRRRPTKDSPLRATKEESVIDVDGMVSTRETSENESDGERGRGHTPRSLGEESAASNASLMPRRSARSASLPRPMYVTEQVDTDGGAMIAGFDLSSEDEYKPGSDG